MVLVELFDRFAQTFCVDHVVLQVGLKDQLVLSEVQGMAYRGTLRVDLPTNLDPRRTLDLGWLQFPQGTLRRLKFEIFANPLE